MITNEQLCSLSSRAYYLNERLVWNQYEKNKTSSDNNKLTKEQSELAQQRITLWRNIIAEETPSNFEKRLLWEDWNSEDLETVLGKAPIIKFKDLPDWALLLKSISDQAIILQTQQFYLNPLLSVSHSASEQSDVLEFPLQDDKPLPFEDLLLPILAVARGRLKKTLQPLHTQMKQSNKKLEQLISNDAYLHLERLLLQQLSELSRNTLGLVFSKDRPSELFIFSLFLDNKEKVPTNYYHTFVNDQLRCGMLPLFEKYPVLGRILATAVIFWVEFITEFLQRWWHDHLLVTDKLQLSESTTVSSFRITGIQGNVSDPHNRGRTVLLLTVSRTSRFVYKPRSLSSEYAYNQLLEWCNQPPLSLSFKTLSVIDQGDYGWVLDFVEPQPCIDENAVQRFYDRAGKMLCLTYCLGANDLHSENLIAAGEHPVIIDTETLLHPKAKSISETYGVSLGADEEDDNVSDSVLRTGLLPHWEFNSDYDAAYDISGLGRADDQQAPWQALRWQHINTDHMMLAPEDVKLPSHNNVPVLNGCVVSPEKYLKYLCAGFQTMYHLLMKHYTSLLNNHTLQQLLSLQRIRFLFRPTEVYGALLEKSLLPQCLSDGVLRSLELDTTCQTYLRSEQRPAAYALLSAELNALHEQNVPYFSGYANVDELTTSVGEGASQPLKNYLKQSSYHAFIDRLNGLNNNDLQHQLLLIKGAFHARMARTELKIHKDSTDGANRLNVKSDQDQSIDNRQRIEKAGIEKAGIEKGQLIEKAAFIAQQLSESAVECGADRISWLGLNYVAGARRFQFQPLGHSLYDGYSGVALFFAGFGAVTGNHEYAPFIEKSTHALRHLLRTNDAAAHQLLMQRLGIGGARGLGSIVYAFASIAYLTDQSRWVEDAKLAAQLVSKEDISNSQHVDIIDGVAGLLLGLLKLYRLTKDQHILHQCCECGEKLVRSLTTMSNHRSRAWCTLGGKALTGFSHGAAGISYALLQLNAVCADSRWVMAAQEGINYERDCYISQEKNWPDFRQTQQDNKPMCAMSWCHGAPGIVLSRLAMLNSGVDNNSIQQDINDALETVCQQPLASIDHICCGNFGLVETMLVAAKGLQRPEYFDAALLKVQHTLERSNTQGGFQLFGNLDPSVTTPGLFQGSSGIAYQLLRLAYPEKLPSVLLWQ